jgi:predicted TIM-barrel fold metal-dependent hydrolase
VRKEAQSWRAEHLFIDLHEHIDPTPAHLARAIAIQDAVGIGLAVNLSGGTVTRNGRAESELEMTKAISDRLYPSRFLEYVNLDYADWDKPDFSARAVKQIDEGYRLGAAGFKEFKRLGLYLRDRAGKLIHVDDPKLDPVWKRCGELGMPVSIHTAAPSGSRSTRPTNGGRSLRITEAGGSGTPRNTRHARSSWPSSIASLPAIPRRHSYRFTSRTTRKTSHGWMPRSIATRT